MKTILRIAIILLVAAVVAGGFYLVVNSTSLVSSSGEEGRQPLTMTSAEGTRPEEMPERGGDEHGASLTRGLAGVFGSLLKLAVIVALVLIVEKGVSLFGKKPAASPA
ncbi:MAG: hypothetical protein L6461_03670 [Anaerolineae bacterium]|nr:hypothetical protein [Anaerolineae bacterium]